MSSTRTTGPGDHARAVAALREQYAALPPGAPVRLGKRTSNLFRFRPPAAGPRLDVSRFDRVLDVDPVARTADVQGMVTYETLVAATLPYGLMPLVVPQLKTITVGGAVVGLGIESSSFRNGLPHESVLEMEILTGDGRVVVARPDGEHADLFAAFPNSYGTLGYALRLRVELEPVAPYVRLRHVRFDDARRCADAVAAVCATGAHDGEPVDFVDGTVFGPDELYLTLGSFTTDAPAVSDYTGADIYYRSIRRREVDHLTVADYLWRWDTDWFWCSRAFGVQHPVVRRLWPRRWRRSDVYRRLVALDRRFQVRRGGGRGRGRPPAGSGDPGRGGAGGAAARLPRLLARRGGHLPDLAVPAAAARHASVAALPARPRRAVRQRRVLVDRAAAARAGARPPQPPGGAGGRRPRRAQVALLDGPLLRGRVLAALRRRGVRQGQAVVRPGRPAA